MLSPAETLALVEAMMKNDQHTGDNSIAIVSRGSVSIHTGVSVSDVKEICRDMMLETMAGMQREAKEEVEKRNEKLVDDLLARAEERFGETVEEKLNGFKDPGAQYAFKQAQNGYCRYGNEESKDNAIELILERLSKTDQIDEKIIIDEAIEKSSRLTSRQVDILTFIFLFFKYNVEITNLSKLDKYLSTISDMMNFLPLKTADISMLKVHGLIVDHSATRHWIDPEPLMRKRHWGLFSKGFKRSDLDFDTSNINLFALCLRNPSLIQPNHVNADQWRALLSQNNLSPENIELAMEKAEQATMTTEEIKIYLDNKSTKFSLLRADFASDQGVLKYSDLTSVGTAIAFAKIKRFGFYGDAKISDFI